MGRMLKEGLSFFPLDVEYFNDDKVVDLTFDKKLISEVVFIHSLALIYHDGYYIKTTPDRFAKKVFMSLHGKTTLTVKEVLEIIYKITEVDLLDKGMMDQGIITSMSIQKQYYFATVRRKERGKEYWLLNDEDEAKMDIRLNGRQKSDLNGISVDKNEVEPEFPQQYDDDNRHNKNKSKNKKKNEKNTDIHDQCDKGDRCRFPGYLNYYTSCLIEAKVLSEFEPEQIDKFNELFESVQRAYSDNELINRCFRHTRDYVKNNKDSIGDVYAFFHSAFTSNLEKMEGYDERMQKFFEGWKDVLGGVHAKD